MDPKQAIQFLLISIAALVILVCLFFSCESVCTKKCRVGIDPESSSRSDAQVKEDAFYMYDVENLTEVKTGESDSGDKDEDDSASTTTSRTVEHQDGEE
jgi:hypothetical protein